MVHIDYDILFSVQVALKKDNATSADRVSPLSWRFTPSPSTLPLMRKKRMLFKQIGEKGLMLMEPDSYEEEISGNPPETVEKGVFDIAQVLSFTIEVSLNQKALNGELDLGPEPSSGDNRISADKRKFFELVFPRKRPAYVLKNDRLTNSSDIVGHEDAIVSPVSRLKFDKNMFSDIVLSGPIASTNEIPPNTIVIFENGEEKVIENPSLFEFPIEKIPEAIYKLSGNKINADMSQSPFSGEIFLNKGVVQTGPVVYLLIEIPVGKTKSGEHNFVVNIKQKELVATS